MMDTFTSGSSGSSHQKQHLALRVALDTMKDRCILQQKRLSEVEEENQQLRERLTQNTKPNGNALHNAAGVAENFQLRLQVSELQRQNVQLNAHINMVSSENRKLWQRLSQMAKEQSKPARDKEVSGAIDSEEGASPRGAAYNGVPANQHLIRSKTFTQHSPNPNLRHKLLSADNCGSKEMLDVSLETDVALEAFDDDNDNGKQQFALDNDSSVSQAAVGFAFLNVDDSSPNASPQEHDFNLEARKCMEGFQEMRREATRQQQELHSVFALLESRIVLQPCPECVKKSHKPEMADKSLETDESLNDATKHSNNTNANDLNITYPDSSAKVLPVVQNNQLNIIQEKILADQTNNMCPMCGKIYGSQVTFESFCEHVEEHFRDDNMLDVDHSIEHNFEFISQAVGDF